MSASSSMVESASTNGSSILPTVSVVIPCYGYGRFLESCVRSILNQQGVDVRILIIDDASLDDSFAVAQSLAARDPRVEARRHDVNRGHIATYNEGLLDWAQGDYSVLISADDILVPGALARAVRVMEEQANVGLVYGHAINWIDSLPLPDPRLNTTYVRVWNGMDWLRTVCKLGHNVITSPEVVVRTKVQHAVGGYRPELPHTGDLEMWLRFAAHCDIAFLEGADQAYYRIHSRNMTVTRSPIIDLEQRVTAFDSFFAECGSRISDVGRLQEMVQRSIAKEALWRACRAYDRRRLSTTPVLELKELARKTYAHSSRLSEYWGLGWRERLGPSIPPLLQFLMFSAVVRRIRKMLWWRRWRLKGY